MIFKGTVTAEQANQICRNYQAMKFGELDGQFYQIGGIRTETTPDRIEMEVMVRLVDYVPDRADFRCTFDELLRGLKPVKKPESFERQAARRAIERMEAYVDDSRKESGLKIAVEILREEMGIND